MLSGHYSDLPDDFSQNGLRQSFVHFIVDLQIEREILPRDLVLEQLLAYSESQTSIFCQVLN